MDKRPWSRYHNYFPCSAPSVCNLYYRSSFPASSLQSSNLHILYRYHNEHRIMYVINRTTGILINTLRIKLEISRNVNTNGHGFNCCDSFHELILVWFGNRHIALNGGPTSLGLYRNFLICKYLQIINIENVLKNVRKHLLGLREDKSPRCLFPYFPWCIGKRKSYNHRYNHRSHTQVKKPINFARSEILTSWFL